VAELSDKLNYLKYLYQEICLGFSEFEYLGKPIFIKHFTELELGSFQKNKSSYEKEAIDKKLERKEDKLRFYISQGIWEESKETEIENLTKEISDLNLILNNLFIKSQVLQTKDKIRKVENKLKEINNEKNEMLGFCIEDYVEKKFTENYILNCFYKSKSMNERFFSQEAFDDLSSSDFSDLVYIINSFQDRVSHEEIKRIAACSFVMNMFQVCSDNAYYFYGKYVKDLSSFQINLFNQCRYFKNLMSNSESAVPPIDVAEDPDKMIEWYDTVKSTTNKKENDKESLGVGYRGASKEELQSMAGGNAQTLSDIAKKKGGKLSKQDFMKLHGI
jgi:hypothetical protein